MEILELAPSVFRDYCKLVKGNESITYDLARKKLTRNVLLATKLPPREQDIDKSNELYCYGNLYILVKGKTIIHIKNHKGGNCYHNWKLNKYRYVDISRELGIANEEE